MDEGLSWTPSSPLAEVLCEAMDPVCPMWRVREPSMMDPLLDVACESAALMQRALDLRPDRFAVAKDKYERGLRYGVHETALSHKHQGLGLYETALSQTSRTGSM